MYSSKARLSRGRRGPACATQVPFSEALHCSSQSSALLCFPLNVRGSGQYSLAHFLRRAPQRSRYYRQLHLKQRSWNLMPNSLNEARAITLSPFNLFAVRGAELLSTLVSSC